jgi:hypothetical protein
MSRPIAFEAIDRSGTIQHVAGAGPGLAEYGLVGVHLRHNLKVKVLGIETLE